MRNKYVREQQLKQPDISPTIHICLSAPSVRLTVYVCSYVKNKTEHCAEHKRNQRLTSTNEPAKETTTAITKCKKKLQYQTNLTDCNFDFFSTD